MHIATRWHSPKNPASHNCSSPATMDSRRSISIAGTAHVPSSTCGARRSCANAPAWIPTRSSCCRSCAKWMHTMTHPSSRPLQPGDPAPDFMLPAVQTDNIVSLSDYRGRSPLFLALFRGLYCPFCRRAIAHMAGSAEKLKPLGFESLAVVATDLENARLYYRFRPMRVPLAVDPSL